MSRKMKRFLPGQLTILTVATAIVFLHAVTGQAQFFQANGNQQLTVPITRQPSPTPQPSPRSEPEPPKKPSPEAVKAFQDLLKEQPYFQEHPEEIDRLLPQPAPHAELIPQAAAAPSPGFPIRITDVQGYARAAVVVDTTRLDPSAISSGFFLPAAIPAKGEAFYGLGERTTFQGQGTSAGFSWFADLGENSITGATKAEVTTSSTGDPTLIATQAWLAWKNVTFGITDSVFTDVDCEPDTVDVGGPNARPWFRSGQAQIRYTFSPPNSKNDPTGLYLTGSVEAPGADVYTPATAAGTPVYSTFSECPDFVAALKYRRGQWAANPCTQQQEYNEQWHVQWGSVLRDIGVERSDNSVRDDTFGWGTQLSGQYTILRNPCEGLRDFIYFSITYGEGIGRYFNDLHLVNAVDDATYESTTNTLTPTPLLGYFGAITHEWSTCLRSTAVYSHLELDNRQITGGSTTVLPYHGGDYASINLMYHMEPCVPNPSDPSKKTMLQHHLVAGMEYLYGQKENVAGAFGNDQRVMFMIGAAN